MLCFFFLDLDNMKNFTLLCLFFVVFFEPTWTMFHHSNHMQYGYGVLFTRLPKILINSDDKYHITFKTPIPRVSRELKHLSNRGLNKSSEEITLFIEHSRRDILELDKSIKMLLARPLSDNEAKIHVKRAAPLGIIGSLSRGLFGKYALLIVLL